MVFPHAMFVLRFMCVTCQNMRGTWQAYDWQLDFIGILNLSKSLNYDEIIIHRFDLPLIFHLLKKTYKTHIWTDCPTLFESGTRKIALDRQIKEGGKKEHLFIIILWNKRNLLWLVWPLITSVVFIASNAINTRMLYYKDLEVFYYGKNCHMLKKLLMGCCDFFFLW